MLMIRFQRIGRKNDPAFRMLVLEKSSGPKAGTYVDLVGTYNPKTKAITLQPERIKDWVAKGAQVSPSLMNLLISKGVFEGKKQNVLPKKTPIKKDEPAAAAPAAAPAAEEAAPAEATPEVTPEEVATVEEAPIEEAAVEAAPEEAPAAEEVPAEEVAAEEPAAEPAA